MSPAASKSLVIALRALADVLEAEAGEERSSEASTGGARYYTRKSWIQSGGEARAFDRAIEAIPSIKLGRRRTVLCDQMHAWIEGHAVIVGPRAKASAVVSVPDVTDVDRELGRMGESPRTTEEIDFDDALRELGMGPVTAASIVADRRKGEAKELRDADPEIARESAEATRRADALPRKNKYPLLTCARCLRTVGQNTKWRKERGVRVDTPGGKPLRHQCPHGFSNGCYNAQGNSEEDGTILCPWCAADRASGLPYPD